VEVDLEPEHDFLAKVVFIFADNTPLSAERFRTSSKSSSNLFTDLRVKRIAFQPLSLRHQVVSSN
jgi:hypothetical protein